MANEETYSFGAGTLGGETSKNKAPKNLIELFFMWLRDILNLFKQNETLPDKEIETKANDVTESYSNRNLLNDNKKPLSENSINIRTINIEDGDAKRLLNYRHLVPLNKRYGTHQVYSNDVEFISKMAGIKKMVGSNHPYFNLKEVKDFAIFALKENLAFKKEDLVGVSKERLIEAIRSHPNDLNPELSVEEKLIIGTLLSDATSYKLLVEEIHINGIESTRFNNNYYFTDNGLAWGSGQWRGQTLQDILNQNKILQDAARISYSKLPDDIKTQIQNVKTTDNLRKVYLAAIKEDAKAKRIELDTSTLRNFDNFLVNYMKRFPEPLDRELIIGSMLHKMTSEGESMYYVAIQKNKVAPKLANAEKNLGIDIINEMAQPDNDKLSNQRLGSALMYSALSENNGKISEGFSIKEGKAEIDQAYIDLFVGAIEEHLKKYNLPLYQGSSKIEALGYYAKHHPEIFEVMVYYRNYYGYTADDENLDARHRSLVRAFGVEFELKYGKDTIYLPRIEENDRVYAKINIEETYSEKITKLARESNDQVQDNKVGDFDTINPQNYEDVVKYLIGKVNQEEDNLSKKLLTLVTDEGVKNFILKGEGHAVSMNSLIEATSALGKNSALDKLKVLKAVINENGDFADILYKNKPPIHAISLDELLNTNNNSLNTMADKVKANLSKYGIDINKLNKNKRLTANDIESLAEKGSAMSISYYSINKGLSEDVLNPTIKEGLSELRTLLINDDSRFNKWRWYDWKTSPNSEEERAVRNAFSKAMLGRSYNELTTEEKEAINTELANENSIINKLIKDRGDYKNLNDIDLFKEFTKEYEGSIVGFKFLHPISEEEIKKFEVSLSKVFENPNRDLYIVFGQKTIADIQKAIKNGQLNDKARELAKYPDLRNHIINISQGGDILTYKNYNEKHIITDNGSLINMGTNNIGINQYVPILKNYKGLPDIFLVLQSLDGIDYSHYSPHKKIEALHNLKMLLKDRDFNNIKEYFKGSRYESFFNSEANYEKYLNNIERNIDIDRLAILRGIPKRYDKTSMYVEYEDGDKLVSEIVTVERFKELSKEGKINNFLTAIPLDNSIVVSDTKVPQDKDLLAINFSVINKESPAAMKTGLSLIQEDFSLLGRRSGMDNKYLERYMKLKSDSDTLPEPEYLQYTDKNGKTNELKMSGKVFDESNAEIAKWLKTMFEGLINGGTFKILDKNRQEINLVKDSNVSSEATNETKSPSVSIGSMGTGM